MGAEKIILGLGGAFLLYEWYTGGLSSLFGGSTAATTTTTTSGTTTASSAAPGSTVSASPYTDAQLLAGFNSLAFTGAVPADQLQRVSSQFDSTSYASATTVAPGTFLAYVLGLGNGQGDTSGQNITGSDSKSYQWNGSVFQRLNGLGMLIDLTKLFAGATPGKGFGAREFHPDIAMTLNGLAEIVDDAQNSAAYIDEGPFVEAASFQGSNNSQSGNVTDFYLAAEGQGA